MSARAPNSLGKIKTKAELRQKRAINRKLTIDRASNGTKIDRYCCGIQVLAWISSTANILSVVEDDIIRRYISGAVINILEEHHRSACWGHSLLTEGLAHRPTAFGIAVAHCIRIGCVYASHLTFEGIRFILGTQVGRVHW